MDVILTQQIAMYEWRRMRCGEPIRLEPTALTEVPRICDHAGCERWLSSPEVKVLIGVDVKGVLPIREDAACHRGHSAATRGHVSSYALPAFAFWELRTAAQFNEDSMRDSETPWRLLVDGPELCVLSAANALLELVREGAFPRWVAELKLSEYMMELCGTYSRDPKHPQTGTCTFDIHPVTSVENIEKCFGEGHERQPGVRLIRDALRWARDNSRSPMESVAYLAWRCPPRYGCISAGQPKLNESLKLSKRQLSLIKHRTITPDIQLDFFDALVEYLGDESHRSRAAHDEDRRRWQDYTTLGLRSYPMTFDDIKSPGAFMAFCRRLAEGMNGPQRRARMQHLNRLCRNDRFVERQAQFLKWMLPPVTRYDDYLGGAKAGMDALWGF